MSNLNGENYSIPTTGNKPFVYTRFKDQLICRVDRNASDGFRLREMELQGGGNGQDQWEPGPQMSWSLLREAGENNRLMTITSENAVLAGETLSAYSGFLEQKFRAYDYNIGRETARRELSRASGSGLLRVDPSAPGVMPPIDWVVGERNPGDKECNRSFTLGRDLASWADAKALRSGIATSSGAEGGA